MALQQLDSCGKGRAAKPAACRQYEPCFYETGNQEACTDNADVLCSNTCPCVDDDLIAIGEAELSAYAAIRHVAKTCG